VTNGTTLLPSIKDTYPSAAFRRYRDIVAALVSDAGGPELCGEMRKQLSRAFASCSVLREQSEAKLAAGVEVDIRAHALLCSTLTRLATKLGGLDRVARDITPDPLEYARNPELRRRLREAS